MSDRKKLSIEDVAAVVENEGLGYAVQHYMRGSSIADPKLAKMWDEAAKLLDAIDKRLGTDE